MQRVFYFPLKTKLQALLNVPAYRSMLEHEFIRDEPVDDDIMSDVYDAPIWKRFMGTMERVVNRIGKCFLVPSYRYFLV